MAWTLLLFVVGLGFTWIAQTVSAVQGVGKVFGEPIINEAILRFSLTRDDLMDPVSFLSLLQQPAICSLLGQPGCQVADFMITDEYLDASTGKTSDTVHFLALSSAITPIFNVPGVDKLVLKKDVLAKIFRGCNDTVPQCLPGSITQWGDPQIKATNPPSIHPYLDAAGPIQVVVRQEGSGSTYWMKSALAKFEKSFLDQIGVDRTTTWNGTNPVIKIPTGEGASIYVSQHPGTIGYSKSTVTFKGTNRVTILGNDGVSEITATTKAIYRSVSEVDLDPVKEAQVDLTGSTSSLAWPIPYPWYFVLRTNVTLNNCKRRRDLLLEFFEYYYDWQTTQVFPEGISAMTAGQGQIMLQQLRERLFCNDVQVYQFPSPLPRIRVYAPTTFQGPVTSLSNGFLSTNSVQTVVDILPPISNTALETQFSSHQVKDDVVTGADDGFIAFANHNLVQQMLVSGQNIAPLVSVPLASYAYGFIYNLCPPGANIVCDYADIDPIVFTVDVALKIAEGIITMWNDTQIQELNPSVQMPNYPIQVVAAPRDTDTFTSFVQMIRENYDPSFTGLFGPAEATVHQAFLRVSIVPYTFAFVSFDGMKEDRVVRARLMSRDGIPLNANSSTIEACHLDTYHDSLFTPSFSQNPHCYPLVETMYLLTRRDYQLSLDMDLKPAKAVANFAKFIVDNLRRTIYRSETAMTLLEMGTMADLIIGTNDLIVSNLEALKSIAIDGVSILVIPQKLNLIPSGLIYAVYVIAAILLASFTGLAFWVQYYRHRKLVRNSSPSFMHQVLVGASIQVCTVFALAQQDSFLVPEASLPSDIVRVPGLDQACVAQPILFSFGFFITFSALFLKTWRLIRIFNNRKLVKLYLKDRLLMLYQVGVIVGVVALNLIWVLISPLQWLRSPVYLNEDGLMVESIGLCYSPAGIYPALPLMAGVLAVLVLGNYLAYIGRRIPTEFNESKWTAIAMVVTLESFVLGVPVLVLANDQPVAGFIVKSMICLLVGGGTVALVFFPKLALAYGFGDVDDSNPWRFIKGESSGSRDHKPSSREHVEGQVSTLNRANKIVAPSLNSLMDGKIVATRDDCSSTNPSLTRPFSTLRTNPKAGVVPSSKTLQEILQSDPMRRRFRRYLQTLKSDENVRFWDCVTTWKTDPSLERRAVTSRSIIQAFVLDNAQFQINLSSAVRSSLLTAYQTNDKFALSDENLFRQAMLELFSDIRQSDGFRAFLDSNIMSNANLSSKSDPMVLDENDVV